jgi:hypothetical protein
VPAARSSAIIDAGANVRSAWAFTLWGDPTLKLPHSRLAGLVTKAEKAEDHRLIPLLFAEVKLSPPAAGKVPRLVGRVPGNSYAFVWDARRESGYLLVVPPTRQTGDLKFEVRWGE